MHSLDSHRLLEELVGECQRANSQISALIEVNVSGDASKTGLPVEQVPKLIEAMLAQRQVLLCGLMGMAPLGSTSETARQCFASLRQLRDRMQQQFPEANLSQLSMGMSGDFREAIAEGSTVVRIGSALFEA
jgi:pyridoxal phosphate enzyme (YggS family)